MQSWYLNDEFPFYPLGMFGFFNIFSDNSFFHSIAPCQSNGNIYAWNISDWQLDSRIERKISDQEMTGATCQGTDVMRVQLTFKDAVNIASIMKSPDGLVDLQKENNFVPFMSGLEDYNFINIYSNKSFTGEWCWGEPNGDAELCINGGQNGDEGYCYKDVNCDASANPSFFNLSGTNKFTLR